LDVETLYNLCISIVYLVKKIKNLETFVIVLQTKVSFVYQSSWSTLLCSLIQVQSNCLIKDGT